MLTLEQQIFKQLEKSENILIAFNTNWNGDAIASALALFLFLQKMGKKVEIVAHLDTNAREKNTNNWSFLPAYNKIQTTLKNLRRFIVSLDISQTTINQIKYTIDEQKLNFIISPEKGWFSAKDISTSSSGFKYDLVFSLDAPDFESLGTVYDNNVEFFYKTTVINIDHQASNEEYGQINYLDLNLVSTAEIVFNLLKQHSHEKIDENIATCLLAGIISKTKNYKNTNLTPRTLLTSSKLISLGARREEIINQIYRSRPLSVLKSWGKILNNLQSNKNKQILWSILEGDDARALKEEKIDLNEIVEEIITSIPEAKLIFIAGVNDQAKTLDVSAYAIKGLSALDILKPFSATGDAKIARAKVEISPEEWPEKFIAPLQQKLDKNSS